MSKFNTLKNITQYYQMVHKLRGAHLQYVNNYYAKFEYKGMETVTSYRLHKPDTV